MSKTPEEIAAEEAAEKAAKDAAKDSETPESKLATALAEADKWKALSRKNETRAEENAAKAKRFDEAEESNKTELERERTAREKAEKVLAERDMKDQAAQLRKDVAKEKGFEDRNISISALRGSTREELEAHADEILALLPETPAAPSADGQGSNGNQIGDGDMSADDIVAAATTR